MSILHITAKVRQMNGVIEDVKSGLGLGRQKKKKKKKKSQSVICTDGRQFLITWYINKGRGQSCPDIALLYIPSH